MTAAATPEPSKIQPGENTVSSAVKPRLLSTAIIRNIWNQEHRQSSVIQNVSGRTSKQELNLAQLKNTVSHNGTKFASPETIAEAFNDFFYSSFINSLVINSNTQVRR